MKKILNGIIDRIVNVGIIIFSVAWTLVFGLFECIEYATMEVFEELNIKRKGIKRLMFIPIFIILLVANVGTTVVLTIYCVFKSIIVGNINWFIKLADGHDEYDDMVFYKLFRKIIL